MWYWFFVIFVLLHGLAHMVYTALARGWIPVTPGQENWTASSWLLAGPIGIDGTRNAGAILFTALTVLFVITTVGLALRAPWATTWLAVSSIASSLLLLTFWDGKFQALTEKGLIGLVINLFLLALLFVFRFPW